MLKDCDERFKDDCYEKVIKVTQLAQAYVPFQFACKLFSKMDALKKGTVFPELYGPYQKNKKR